MNFYHHRRTGVLGELHRAVYHSGGGGTIKNFFTIFGKIAINKALGGGGGGWCIKTCNLQSESIVPNWYRRRVRPAGWDGAALASHEQWSVSVGCDFSCSATVPACSGSFLNSKAQRGDSGLVYEGL